MGKNFCYCIGGTGARVAEVAAHLCAANLVGDQDITFVIVDKDEDCGGTIQAKSVIESISNLSGTAAGNPGLERSNSIDTNAVREFCKSKLHVDTSWNFTKALESIAPSNIGGNDSLRSTLSDQGIAQRDNDRMLFDAFYSEEESSTNTAGGFYGKPTIGALIFDYMAKKGNWNNATVETDIAFPVKQYLIANPNDCAKVFIIGSIFGGTGASIFSNLACHLRSSVDQATSDRLFISGVLLLPYFSFSNKGKDSRIDPTAFYEKSRVALDQYARDPNLLRKATNINGYFDTLYVCGQDPLQFVNIYADCGPEQNNHFNIVDLVAAKAMTEFFCKPVEAGRPLGGLVYEYRFEPNAQNPAIVDFNCTPGLKQALSAMLVFSAFVICRVYGLIKIEGTSPSHFVYHRLYGAPGLFGYSSAVKHTYDTETRPEFERVANLVFGYCNNFLRFATDLAKNGYDWGADQIGESGGYSFFNNSYIQRLTVISENIQNGNYNAATPLINSFKNANDYISGVPGLSIAQIENYLQGKFDHVKFNAATPALRMGDYLHEAFKYIFANC